MSETGEEPKEDMLRRALGALYGQFVGDAFGSRYEFMSAAVTRSKMAKDREEGGTFIPLIGGGPFGYGPGVVTDDGEMAMALLASLLAHNEYSHAHVACAYARWAQTNPPDIGMTCSAALSVGAKLDKNWTTAFNSEAASEVLEEIEKRVKSMNKQSLSNGSLMRQSVIPIFFAADEDAQNVIAAVRQDTHLTHFNPDAIAASVAYTTAIHSLINGASPQEATEVALNSTDSKLVRGHIETAKTAMLPVLLPSGQTTQGDSVSVGYLGVALQVAFHQLLHASNFEEGLLAAVAVGGDTDTNGAIAAALLGARFGLDGIPAKWKEAVDKAGLRMEGECGVTSLQEFVKGITARIKAQI